MAQELIIRRRRIGPEDIQRIREVVVAEGERGRAYLSRRLCRVWDWRPANGRFREIACRDLRRQLEARGLILLPAMLCPARRSGDQNPVRAPKLCERLWTVMATCALHQRSPFQWICQAITADFQGQPAPSLIPDTS